MFGNIKFITNRSLVNTYLSMRFHCSRIPIKRDNLTYADRHITMANYGGIYKHTHKCSVVVLY